MRNQTLRTSGWRLVESFRRGEGGGKGATDDHSTLTEGLFSLNLFRNTKVLIIKPIFWNFK